MRDLLVGADFQTVPSYQSQTRQVYLSMGLIGRTLNAMLSLRKFTRQGRTRKQVKSRRAVDEEENDPGASGNSDWDIWRLASLILWQTLEFTGARLRHPL